MADIVEHVECCSCDRKQTIAFDLEQWVRFSAAGDSTVIDRLAVEVCRLGWTRDRRPGRDAESWRCAACAARLIPRAVRAPDGAA